MPTYLVQAIADDVDHDHPYPKEVSISWKKCGSKDYLILMVFGVNPNPTYVHHIIDSGTGAVLFTIYYETDVDTVKPKAAGLQIIVKNIQGETSLFAMKLSVYDMELMAHFLRASW